MSFCISMPHGIHVWHIDLATFIISNVGKYTVHGSYGAAEVPFLGGHYPSWNSRTSAYELRARLLVGETAITKWGWSPIGYEGSLSRFKVQGSFFLLCSSTNFVSYSYEISTSSWLSDVEQLKGVRLAEPATKTTIGQSEMCWDVISLGPLKILNQSDQSVS